MNNKYVTKIVYQSKSAKVGFFTLFLIMLRSYLPRPELVRFICAIIFYSKTIFVSNRDLKEDGRKEEENKNGMKVSIKDENRLSNNIMN